MDDGMSGQFESVPAKRDLLTDQPLVSENEDLLAEDQDAPIPRQDDSSVEAENVYDSLAVHAARCGLRLTKSETQPTAYLKIGFDNGRATRIVSVTTVHSAKILLGLDLSSLKFLGDYSAVCSYSEGWIEAAVRPVNGIFGNLALAEAMFGAPYRFKEAKELVTANDKGHLVRLGYLTQTGLFSRDHRRTMCLRLEGLSIGTHDRALQLLEDLSDSVFMQLDLRYGLPFNLVKDRSLNRRLVSRSRNSSQDLKFTFPRRMFERDAAKLYWSGRSSSATPISQFLAFYQCVEYFFPRYSRQATIEKVKNLLKEPVFDETQDKDLSRLVDLATDAQRNFDERSQLRATVQACVEEGTLRDFICENESRMAFFEKDYKIISREKLELSNGLLESVSKRIYDIRCKVVHTKNVDRGNVTEMILPGSKEADALRDDIEVLQFIAQRVLVVSSSLRDFFAMR
jgi:hypothetical protein